MLNRHPVAEGAPEGFGPRPGVCAISGTRTSNPAAGRHDAAGEAQIDLGLAAPGDAVQQGDAEDALLGQPPPAPRARRVAPRWARARRRPRPPRPMPPAPPGAKGSRSTRRTSTVTSPRCRRLATVDEATPSSLRRAVASPPGRAANRCSAARCRGPMRRADPDRSASRPGVVRRTTRSVLNPPRPGADRARGGIAAASDSPGPQA